MPRGPAIDRARAASLFKAGYSRREVASLMGLAYHSVSRAIREEVGGPSFVKLKPWTTAEVRQAAALWKDGHTVAEIAVTLGRGEQSVKHAVRRNRAMFPARRPERHEGHTRRFKRELILTPFLHHAIEAEAKARGVSQAYLIRDALRRSFIRGEGKRAS
jgi:IS30 family transposase